MLESKINDSRCYTRNSHSLPQTSQNLLPCPRLPFHTPQRPMSPNSLPTRKLTSAQLQDRRSVGLCYNYDEFFFLATNVPPIILLLLSKDPFFEYPIDCSSYNNPDPNPNGLTHVLSKLYLAFPQLTPSNLKVI